MISHVLLAFAWLREQSGLKLGSMSVALSGFGIATVSMDRADFMMRVVGWLVFTFGGVCTSLLACMKLIEHVDKRRQKRRIGERMGDHAGFGEPPSDEC